MATNVNDIVTGMETRIAAVLGPDYKKLAYLEDVQQNNFRMSSNRYGVRTLVSSEVSSVTKYVTFTQTFEVILTKQYLESSFDDTGKESANLELRANMLDIYKDLVNTKAGAPSTVMNVTDLITEETEYLIEDKLAILRTSINITYRLNLL